MCVSLRFLSLLLNINEKSTNQKDRKRKKFFFWSSLLDATYSFCSFCLPDEKKIFSHRFPSHDLAVSAKKSPSFRVRRRKHSWPSFYQITCAIPAIMTMTLRFQDFSRWHFFLYQNLSIDSSRFSDPCWLGRRQRRQRRRPKRRRRQRRLLAKPLPTCIWLSSTIPRASPVKLEKFWWPWLTRWSVSEDTLHHDKNHPTTHSNTREGEGGFFF